MPAFLRQIAPWVVSLVWVTSVLAEPSEQWTEGLELPEGAFSEGELLRIPAEFLPEPPPETATTVEKAPLQKKLSEAAGEKLKSLNETFETAPKTKFNRLADVFNEASMPNPLLFKTDSVALGKCISRFNPETFTLNSVNIYVDVDELLGKQVYFVPVVEEKSRGLAGLSEMTPQQHLKVHKQRRALKKRFTALQTSYPKNIPLFELFKANLKNAFFFSYRPEPRAGDEDTGGVYFRLRGGTNNGKNFLVLQRLCPYYPGCQKEGDTVVDYLNYVDAYAYCYYSKTITFGRDVRLNR